MQTDTIDFLHSCPGMYLPSYEQKFDAASCYATLVKAVFGKPELGMPKSIKVVTANYHFSIHVVGYSLHTLEKSDVDLTSLFDISHFRTPFYDDSYPLGFMRPIVWFSEHCLAEITVADTIYRQAFLYGESVGHQCSIPLNEDTSVIGFGFTLPAKPFSQIKLDISRFRNVVDQWESTDIPRWGSFHTGQLTLRKHWFEQSTYYHSLEIVPELASS